MCTIPSRFYLCILLSSKRLLKVSSCAPNTCARHRERQVKTNKDSGSPFEGFHSQGGRAGEKKLNRMTQCSNCSHRVVLEPIHGSRGYTGRLSGAWSIRIELGSEKLGTVGPDADPRPAELPRAVWRRRLRREEVGKAVLGQERAHQIRKDLASYADEFELDPSVLAPHTGVRTIPLAVIRGIICGSWSRLGTGLSNLVWKWWGKAEAARGREMNRFRGRQEFGHVDGWPVGGLEEAGVAPRLPKRVSRWRDTDAIVSGGRSHVRRPAGSSPGSDLRYRTRACPGMTTWPGVLRLPAGCGPGGACRRGSLA